MMHHAQVGCIVKTLALFQQTLARQQSLNMLMSGISEVYLFVLFFQRVVARPVFLFLQGQTGHQLVHSDIQIRPLIHRTGNNQRSPRLVNQDRVNFIDDGKVATTLYTFICLEGHVVAQVIKAEFVICTVGNICLVGSLLFLVTQARHGHTGGKTHKGIDLAHPFGVAPCEVVIHGHNMHTVSSQCIQVGRQRGHQCLALTGAHFSNSATVQHHAADQLHIERTHLEGAPGGLTHSRKSLG